MTNSQIVCSVSKVNNRRELGSQQYKYKDMVGPSVVYVHCSGDTEQVLGDSHRKRINAIRSSLTTTVQSVLDQQLKDRSQPIQLSFSRTAGCSCGCSPGFFVKGQQGQKLTGYDIWVDVKANQ